MKFLVTVILIALLCFAAEWLLPWWSIAVVTFVISHFAGHRPGRSFWSGFSSVGLCWLIAALWRDIPNNHILSTRMAALFHLPDYMLFIVVTVFVGALIGGLSAWAGALLAAKRS